MRAGTIDDVIGELDGIIDWARNHQNRLGYFPALYRTVTAAVKQGIEDGLFEDGERMERLDVAFAGRYLEAIGRYRDGGTPTRSWRVAFDATRKWWPIVLQHLLLGINAHINLDLGIAAASVSPGNEIQALENDFNKINEILAQLVDDVETKLAAIWPSLGFLDRIAGKTDDAIINFSMEKAREFAWQTALELAPLSAREQAPRIERLDREVTGIARVVRRPGPVIGMVSRIIRLGERGDVGEIIDILR